MWNNLFKILGHLLYPDNIFLASGKKKKAYAVGTQWNHIDEAIPRKTNNLFFHGDIRKILTLVEKCAFAKHHAPNYMLFYNFGKCCF